MALTVAAMGDRVLLVTTLDNDSEAMEIARAETEVIAQAIADLIRSRSIDFARFFDDRSTDGWDDAEDRKVRCHLRDLLPKED